MEPDGEAVQENTKKNGGNIANPEIQHFKATPATVLKIPPFKPKLEHKITEFCEFQLHTEQRARERELFEKKKKEKEERLAELLKQKVEEEIEREKEEVKELRILREFKANPIRYYKDVQRVPPKRLTSPVTPECLRKCKRNRSNGSMESKENLDTSNDTVYSF